MAKVYEFRCPIHGFIEVDEWERDIIAHPAFQRLRRIRQLGWTDYVYPGAMHTRFEHSLGVMHLATRLYNAVLSRSSDVLKREFDYNPVGLDRDRRVVRLAALLHDVGHGPFSHAVEKLLPIRNGDTRYDHEDYSAAMVRGPLRETIEAHPINKSNYGIRADDIADLLEGGSLSPSQGLLFWREIITGQMDADRMDYLLRDSHHLGVQYGRFDLDRLVNTICAVQPSEGKAPRIGVAGGGWHAAESLILARYYMFTQVYFHKTRVAYDHHIAEALAACVPNGMFPKPTKSGLDEYMGWDDWRVLGRIAAGKAGEHGKRLAERNHYRLVFATPEAPSTDEIAQLGEAREDLGDLLVYSAEATKSWYKVDEADVQVEIDGGGQRALSSLSSPVRHLVANNKTFLYTTRESAEEARKRLEKLRRSK